MENNDSNIVFVLLITVLVAHEHLGVTLLQSAFKFNLMFVASISIGVAILVYRWAMSNHR